MSIWIRYIIHRVTEYYMAESDRSVLYQHAIKEVRFDEWEK